MNQRRFFGNDFFYKKFAYSASVKIRSRHSLCAEYRVWAKPNKCFEAGFVKNQVQNLRGSTGSPCLLRLQTRKFLCRKITVRFKLNLKTDGLDCKMIFKFGKHLERLHSTRKQCRRIYICLFCVAKLLVGSTQTLELHPMDAGLASPNEKVYGSNTLSAIGKQLFPVKKENSDD